MKSFTSECFDLEESLKNNREDLIIRVYFITEDETDFALFFVNTKDAPSTDEREFAYDFSDSIDWVAKDLAAKIEESFPTA